MTDAYLWTVEERLIPRADVIARRDSNDRVHRAAGSAWPADTLVGEPRLAHRDRVPGIAQVHQHAAAHRVAQPGGRQRAKLVPFGDQNDGVRPGCRVQRVAAPGDRL